jgi:recombination protein RecT
MLGKKAAGFLSSIMSIYNATPQLQACDPMTIISAAAIAATLDLPINKNLGYAAIVPYKSEAQFQMQYKGYVQLALRSGEYKTMNTSEIFEDEIKFWNPITGEIEFNPIDTWKQRYESKAEKIIGYVAFFKLKNGFEKYVYMTVGQIDAHSKKYSKSYNNPLSLHQKDPHVMRLKTPLKILLSKWGLLSIEMQKALEFDQAVVRETSEGFKPDYVDADQINDAIEPIDEPAKEEPKKEGELPLKN